MRPLPLLQAFLCAGLLFAHSAQGTAPTLAVAPDQTQWLADIDILQASFEQLHPGLYRYNTGPQLQARFDAVRELARSGADFNRMYLALSELAASIRCGHTYTNFGNQPEATKARLYRHAAHLPFHFRWLDGRMIVTGNYSGNPELPAGSEIVSINGVPSARILSTLMRIARADGHNDDKRVDYLQVQGLNAFEAFDIYLPLYFPEIDTQQILEARLPGQSALRRITVQGQTHAQRRTQQHANDVPSGDAAPEWMLEYPQPDVAVLRMSTWALYNTRWDWRAYIRQVFERLDGKQVSRLIIDLRENEGGLSDIGDQLLAHLIESPLALPALQRLVTYRKVPDALVAYLDTWDPGFKDWGEQAAPIGPRSYRLQREGDAGRQFLQPASPRFTGDVIILSSAMNSSATFEFMQRARQAGAARLVGMPTGGNQRGINGGAFFFLTLPHSQIEFDVPLIGQFPASPMPDAGITPDVLVKTTAADIAAARDPVMAAALALDR